MTWSNWFRCHVLGWHDSILDWTRGGTDASMYLRCLACGKRTHGWSWKVKIG